MSQIAFLKRELEEARERKRRAQDEILVLERLLSRHDPDWDIVDNLSPTPEPAAAERPVEQNPTQEEVEADARQIATFIHENSGCNGGELADAFPQFSQSKRAKRLQVAKKLGLIRVAGQGRAARYFKKRGAELEEEDAQLSLDHPKPKKKRNAAKNRKAWHAGPQKEPATTPKVMAALKEHKELDHTGLCRETGLATGSASWVLKWVMNQGLVEARPEGNRVFYSLTSKAKRPSAPATEPSKGPQLIEALREHGMMTEADLIRETGISSGTVNWDIRWYVKTGEVERKTVDGRTYYELTES